MKVRELIELLEREDQDATIVSGRSYHKPFTWGVYPISPLLIWGDDGGPDPGYQNAHAVAVM
jgi:hypothetical protein